MSERKLPRVDLPPDVRLDTLAVREGLPPSQWGENSEALFLTSSFTHPDAEQRDQVRIAEVITASLRLLSNEWKDKIQIDQAVPADLICQANKNKLTQVFVNLLQNSLDALKEKPPSAEPPVIRINGRHEGDKIAVSVRDNGEGIAPENLPLTHRSCASLSMSDVSRSWQRQERILRCISRQSALSVQIPNRIPHSLEIRDGPDFPVVGSESAFQVHQGFETKQ